MQFTFKVFFTKGSAIGGGSSSIGYVSWNLVNCCTCVRESHLKRFGRWLALKVIGSDAVWQAIHQFL